MEIDLWNKIGEIMEMLKSDRFGMEMYMMLMSHPKIGYALKSDRFGMEIRKNCPYNRNGFS